MNTLAKLAAATVIACPGAALAQECAGGLDRLERQMRGAALQAEYKGREEAHPLVMRLQDGTLVDLTGEIVTAEPYESWTGNRPVVDKVGGHVTQGRALEEDGKEAECMAQLDLALAEIRRFSEQSEVTQSAPGEASEEPSPPAN